MRWAKSHQLAVACFYLLDVHVDIFLGADFVEHLKNRFIGPAVQRSGQSGGRGRRCQIRNYASATQGVASGLKPPVTSRVPPMSPINTLSETQYM
jgi:hypothetical protein